jgi:hypothetical protein
MAPFRWLAVTSFSNLFIIGPIATYTVGIGYTLLLITLPTHLLLLAPLAIVLVIQRRLWGMTWLQAIGVVLECAVCPAYLANVCRRMAIRFGVTGDAILFVHNVASPEERLAISRRLDLLVVDLTENADLSEHDVELINGYQSFLVGPPL